MDIIQVLTLIGVAIANIGTTITLFMWATNHAAEDKRAMLSIMKSIQDEMKDFHGRLEKIDAEFKGRMEKQDAEFKAHLMYAHDNKAK